MAIYPNAVPQVHAAPIQAAVTSNNVISDVRGTTNDLTIPLDDNTLPKKDVAFSVKPGEDNADTAVKPQRKLLRRDSLERREALLKGKEGSRQRRRWENDRLLNNPHVQPPLPSDWEVRPTYPQRSVPYYLAPLWDATATARANVEQAKRAGAFQKRARASAEEGVCGPVPKDLRIKLKRSKAAKGLLQDLEEQVRKFVRDWNAKCAKEDAAKEAAAYPVTDSEDEEIVFIGRNGQMADIPPSPKAKRYKEVEDDEYLEIYKEPAIPLNHLIFDGPADDHGASFGRWLVHNIATYYGLRTWSVTRGDPARREAYVGINEGKNRDDRMVLAKGLPRPLWGLV